MSIEIPGDILRCERNVDRNFQRHFEFWNRVMSTEISSDILSCERNVDRNFLRRLGFLKPKSAKIFTDITRLQQSFIDLFSI